MKNTIAVFGSARVKTNSPQYRLGIEIGHLLAGLGFNILCGGFGGIMAAVCRGAKEKGATTAGIGLTCFKKNPNPYLDSYHCVDSLGERLEYFQTKSSIILGMPGGIGTLTEVLYFWDSKKAGSGTEHPILLYGKGWENLIACLENNFIIGTAHLALPKIFLNTGTLEEYLKNKIPA
ncbi:MAG: LOG family protein [bacterium]